MARTKIDWAHQSALGGGEHPESDDKDWLKQRDQLAAIVGGSRQAIDLAAQLPRLWDAAATFGNQIDQSPRQFIKAAEEISRVAGSLKKMLNGDAGGVRLRLKQLFRERVIHVPPTSDHLAVLLEYLDAVEDFTSEMAKQKKQDQPASKRGHGQQLQVPTKKRKNAAQHREIFAQSLAAEYRKILGDKPAKTCDASNLSGWSPFAKLLAESIRHFERKSPTARAMGRLVMGVDVSQM